MALYWDISCSRFSTKASTLNPASSRTSFFSCSLRTLSSVAASPRAFLTAFLIVVISEIGKLNDKLGGLVAALPMVTIFVVCWMYYEGVSENKIANHFKYTILFLIPTLPGFFVVPFIIPKLGVFYSLLVFVLLSAICIFFSKRTIQKAWIKHFLILLLEK